MDTALDQIAAEIPSMGGTKLGPVLIDAAAKAPSGTAFIELGCWLGAGTAQLCVGILRRKNPRDVQLHCFDQWTANPSEVEKAARAGLSLVDGQDTLPVTRKLLSPFDIDIRFHKGRLSDATWSGPAISVYVDDAAKQPKVFAHCVRTFSPFWIPQQTLLILMDYYYWKKSGDARHRCQQEFIEANPGNFSHISDIGTCAVFLYTNALPVTPPGLLRLWRQPTPPTR